MSLNPYEQYRQQTIHTSTPGMLIIMLFENAVKHLNIAIKAINNSNMTDSHNSIIQVQTVYSALRDYLNDGVALSASLKSMYDYILKRLVEANLKKDVEILEEVLSYSVELRDTWREAEKRIHMKPGR